MTQKIHIEELQGKFHLYGENGFAVESDFKHIHLAVRYANDNGMEVEMFEPFVVTPEKIKSKKNLKRFASFFKNGMPKKIRCYDNGGSSDRFTICFTGDYRKTTAGEFYALGANFNPTHPLGFGQHLSCDVPYDRPDYAHLGKCIRFNELPYNVQKWVAIDYLQFWGFMDDKGEWL